MFVKVHSYVGSSKDSNKGSSGLIMDYLDKENKEIKAEIEQLKYEQNLEGYSDVDILNILNNVIEKKELELDFIEEGEEKESFLNLLNEEKNLKSLLEEKQYFYNSESDLSLQEAKVLIDSGNKRLKADESKYFMFTSNPSKAEIEHLQNIVTEKLALEDFNSTYRYQYLIDDIYKLEEAEFLLDKHKYDGENPIHKKELDNLIKDYSKDLIDVYANAFTRRDIDGEKIELNERDLNWVARNETERHYKHWEKEIKHNKEIQTEILDVKSKSLIKEDEIKKSINSLKEDYSSKSFEEKQNLLKESLEVENLIIVKKETYLKKIAKLDESKLDKLKNKITKDFSKEFDATKQIKKVEIDSLHKKLYKQNDKGFVSKETEGEVLKTGLTKSGKNNHTHFVVSKQTKTKWYNGERCKTSIEKALEGLKNKTISTDNTIVKELLNEVREKQRNIELIDTKGNDVSREIEFDKLVRTARKDDVKEVKVTDKNDKEFGLIEFEEKLYSEFKNKSIEKNIYNEYKGDNEDFNDLVQSIKDNDVKVKLFDSEGKEIIVNAEFEKLGAVLENDKLTSNIKVSELEELKKNMKSGSFNIQDKDIDVNKDFKEVIEDLKQGKSKTYDKNFKKVDGRGMSLSPNANSKGTSKKHRLNGKEVSVGFSHEKFKEESGKLFQNKFDYKLKENEQYKARDNYSKEEIRTYKYQQYQKAKDNLEKAKKEYKEAKDKYDTAKALYKKYGQAFKNDYLEKKAELKVAKQKLVKAKTEYKEAKGNYKSKNKSFVSNPIKGKVSGKIKGKIKEQLIGEVAKTELKIAKTAKGVIQNPVKTAKSFLKDKVKEIIKGG